MTLLPEKNYTMPESMCCTNVLKISSKNKNAPNSNTSNERIIIPKLLLNLNFSNLSMKQNWIEKLDISRNLG